MRVIALGFAFLLLGFLLVFLTVVRVISASFPLLLMAYAVSLAGLCLGVIGIARQSH